MKSVGPPSHDPSTRELVRSSHVVEAELLVHLGEIDERKLYLDWSFSSMFASPPAVRREERRAVVAPLAEDTATRPR
jgi:hypothetical protein